MEINNKRKAAQERQLQARQQEKKFIFSVAESEEKSNAF